MEELTRAEIDDLLATQFVARIGCHADGQTYVVPVIYAYDGESFWIVTVEGRKVRMMRENPEVCVEVDEYAEPGRWRSAIAWGRYEELEGAAAEAALARLVERFAGRDERRRPDAEGRETVAFRIRVDEVTGRSVGG